MQTNRDSELTERQGYWLSHIRRIRELRLSMAAYARDQGISVAALYYWKKRLKALGVLPDEVAVAGFAAVRIQPAPGDCACCRIHFPNGVTVEVGETLAGAGLSQLLASVSRLPVRRTQTGLS